MILTQFGFDGQTPLPSSPLFIIGGGGIGCPAAYYLSGAGVGTIAIIDNDKVEESNLHR